MYFGDGLAQVFRLFLFIIAILFCWGAYSTIHFFMNKEIETDKPIVPELRLVVKNNVIDTVFVYREP